MRVWGCLLFLATLLGAQDDAYEKALRLYEKKKWAAGQKAMRRFVEKNPGSPHAEEARLRSDDNCYLGTTVLWEGGPADRRIDVAVMGDGFTHESASQKKQEKWAKLCVDVLFNEKAFSQYRTYFNIYFVRLCSFEEGVDPQLTPEQRRKIEEKNRRRSKSRRKKLEFSTALEARAAGPQGQVLMSRPLVHKWLQVADRDVPGVADDKYVIAFAQFGKLGMGGGSIANVGRPDKSVTTHEFGHAFSRLLDEYAIHPAPPQGVFARTLRAANTHASTAKPRREDVPWAHFLKKRTKGVGIFEGGATFKKGVWRPARSCAMNSAGNNQFCPVCREQSILVIYEHVNPIDVAEPDPGPMAIREGDDHMLRVTPMAPYKHKLHVDWYVAEHVVTEANSAAPAPIAVKRAQQDRGFYASPPSGKKSRLAKLKKGVSSFPLEKLPVGTWRITCQVEDRTKLVLKDEKHLLKERVSWIVTVKPQVQASAG